jgi:hypothetical protein
LFVVFCGTDYIAIQSPKRPRIFWHWQHQDTTMVRNSIEISKALWSRAVIPPTRAKAGKVFGAALLKTSTTLFISTVSRELLVFMVMSRKVIHLCTVLCANRSSWSRING